MFIGLLAVCTLISAASCTEKWEEEQYEQYVSFKAPVDSSTVTRVRVKYKEDGVVYRLPLLVSGTTVNNRDLEVHTAVDSDTLHIYNIEHFGEERQDLWYKELDPVRFTFDSITHIPAGEVSSLIDIRFDFSGVDFSDNWVLPLIIQDDPSFNYQSNPRLGYNNALLWMTPFNDYSGTYQATALNVYAEGNGNKLNLSTREAYVTGENSVFFYMGAIEETRVDRKLFKMEVTFHPDDSFVPEEGSDKIAQGTVTLRAMSDDSRLNFQMIGTPTYTITENMDKERPVMLRRLVTIAGLSYSFEDPNEVPGHTITYKVNGSMSLQRNINTTIPDEEFAIEW